MGRIGTACADWRQFRLVSSTQSPGDDYANRPELPGSAAPDDRLRRTAVRRRNAARDDPGLPAARAASRQSAATVGAIGNTTVNVEPTPTALCTSIRPPCSRTSRSAKAKPRPAPS